MRRQCQHAGCDTGATSGAVRIYNFQNGLYRYKYLVVSDFASPLNPPFFGGSIAMSGDGKVVAVGAPNTNGDNAVPTGAAYVFNLP
jgi:FG-GAP repeat